ncbi:DNA cytosine methyltransferase [Pseudanabaena cinerea]|uniref:DNA cytosine methyltransferase n=1 Tax=Pseudanabaena cinerea TaxID=2661616 RepID=UPI0018F00C30|nr:DNA cytosine methyltransferase [Pseudanabaena cinerea]
MENQRPIAVDLFAGVGGMTLGFEQAGFDVLASVEIDPIHCATHEYNFPMWTAICASVTEISGDDIRAKSKIGDRDVDVVFGGPPCQGFSMMGKRAFDDPRNQLVSHFMRLVKELNAKYFVMENVKGLTLGNHRQFLDEVIENFKENGYRILNPYKVLNASHFGVPQHRERLFLIGCRQDLTLPSYPSPSTKPAKAKRIPKELLDLPDCPTVRDAIADLPDVAQYPELMQQDWCVAEFHEPQNDYSRYLRGFGSDKIDLSYSRYYNPKELTASLLEFNVYGTEVSSRVKLLEHLLSKAEQEAKTIISSNVDANLLTSSIGTLHTPMSISRFRSTANGEVEKISRFLKLDPDGICNTLRAGTPSNRGAFTAPRPIHPHEARCITVREAARLHSYPDWFRFHVTKWHGFRQIGNSVPPLLARAVATELREILGVKLKKPSQKVILSKAKDLQIKMVEAAEKYGVDPHVIEPRIRQEID